ncbi:MAG: hypothetical protein PHE06_12215 [Lachnospiraceae bacterium]|nr:hypothetical protein [Lachnospiraceae bacterium]
MEKNLSGMLVETVVKKALKNIVDSPERGIRNLVDMALQFSKGRFQTNFFTVAQTMLQNENSAYYRLVRDTVAYADMDRLYTFGMNLGYNGCTVGARNICRNEERLNCNIPWTISVQIDTHKFKEKREKYDTLIREGENLGIYTWMLFDMDDPQKLLAFAGAHPDSAFCIFCKAENLSAAFLDEASDFCNVMLVVRYEENIADLCAAMREMGLLYSVWYQYGQEDAEVVINDNLFSSSQQLCPVFTVLIPEAGCPEEIRRLVYQAAKEARSSQIYRTVIWDFQGDNRLIDSIISGDSCSVYFDRDGNLYDWDKKFESKPHNLFQNSLSDILASTYSKNAGTPAST